MSEISVVDLHKYYGESHILQGLSFTVAQGERVGIVGANGCGKTTLFKILAGTCDYDGGEIAIPAGRRIGMLEQLFDFPDGMTVRQVLWQAFSDIEQMGERLHAMEAQMAAGEDVDMHRYANLQTAFEAAGGYDLSVPYRMMTNGLKIPEEMQNRPFNSLSGGEKTRVGLAKIMLSGSDILLLDEPTNHLDIESIEWLEEYLRTFRGTVMIISHDRYFLDRTTTKTFELEDGKATVYPGNYSYYVDARQERAEQLEAAQKRQQKEIDRLAFTVERMKGWGLGNKKVMRRAFAMEKRLNRIERIQTLKKAHKMKSRFTEADASGDEVFYLENLSVGYDRPLIEDFSAMVLKGERIAILGANGCGKTTFLNTLLKRQPPLKGRIYEGVGLKFGYLPQVVSFAHPERNLLDTMLYETGCDVQQSRDRLAAFAFRGDDVYKTVDVLSGGEKTRLKLCMFMYQKINTMFLDEPTNHLDILSKEWIEEAIDDFSETLIFVSHDRYFINRFATRIWYVEDGHVRDFAGTFEAFTAMRQREMQQRNAPAHPAASPKSKEGAKKGNVKSQEKQRKELERQAAALETQIDDHEREMNACGDDYTRLNALFGEKEALEQQLLAVYEQLEALGG